MYYAPVLITTLNRYEHFKRCLESLERCTGADKTEVYVGLDYPPSEKYIDGWKKIDDYLQGKETCNGFLKLIVKRRDHNLGVCCKNSNSQTLLAELPQNTPYYITTEDDNEFSPNFLEYMNKCLERFKNDERIIIVCGYAREMLLSDHYRNNFVLTKNGSPWGMGVWPYKIEKIEPYFNASFLRAMMRDRSIVDALDKKDDTIVDGIISMLKTNRIYDDTCIGLYCAVNDIYTIVPTSSKVRNHGNDGSGVHCPKMSPLNDYYVNKPIDTEPFFDFTNDIFCTDSSYLKIVYKKQKSYSIKGLYKYFVGKLDRFLLMKFNYLPKSKYF